MAKITGRIGSLKVPPSLERAARRARRQDDVFIEHNPTPSNTILTNLFLQRRNLLTTRDRAFHYPEQRAALQQLSFTPGPHARCVPELRAPVQRPARLPGLEILGSFDANA
jgi:hypothetical protein